MSAVLLGDHDPNSPEWHALRAAGIGASEIAAVVGLSPFESPFSLWHRKKGNLPGPDPANELFYWGHALEPVIATRFAMEHREFAPAPMGTHRSSAEPWQLANLDRGLFPPASGVQFLATAEPIAAADIAPLGVLEIKTTRFGDNWGPSGTDQIPVHVRCQVMQQMDVFDVPFAWVAVLIGGNEYREYRIDFDATDATALREAGAAFWASLEADDEPPIDASFETYEAVRDLHPDIDGSDVEIDNGLYDTYYTTKQAADEATAAHRKAKAELLAEMGDARRALVYGTPVLRRQPGRGGSVSLYPVKESA